MPVPTHLRLRPVRLDDEPVVRAAQEAMAADDFPFALWLAPDTPWSEYVDRLQRQHDGEVPPELVPATFLLGEVDGVLVGRASIRHELNDFLLRHGGHIGYGVLPAHRGRGYAHEILRQSLIVARAHGVGRALLTCDEDNAASIAVIERAGGRLDPQWPIDAGPPPGRRYWID